MPDKIKELYDLVSDKGYFKDENELRTFAKDPKSISEVYDLIKDDGYFKDKVEFDNYFAQNNLNEKKNSSPNQVSPTLPNFSTNVTQSVQKPLKSQSPLASNLSSVSVTTKPKQVNPFEVKTKETQNPFTENKVSEYNPFVATIDEINNKVEEERIGKITQQQLDDNPRYQYLLNKKEAYERGYTDDKGLNGKTAEQKLFEDREPYLINKLDPKEQEEVKSLASYQSLMKIGKEKEAQEELQKYLNARSEWRKNIDDQIVEIKATLPNIADPTELELAKRDIAELEIQKKPIYDPKAAMETVLKENANEVAQISKPTETPKERLRKYTNSLYGSVLRQKERLGISEELNGVDRFLAERELYSQNKGAELEKLHQDELKLKNAIKIYELNRTPYEKDTALGVFAKSFAGEIAPYIKSKIGVDNTIANNIQSIVQDANIVDATNKEQLDLAKQYGDNYEFLSAKWAAQNLAPTAAIMTEMIPAAIATEGAFAISGLGKLNRAVTLLSERGSLGKASKIYFGALQNSKIGRGLIKSAFSGLKYGIESEAVAQLAPQIKDEMGFANGLFAGAAGKALGGLSGKILEKSLSSVGRLFGSQAPNAIRAIETYGNMIAKAKDFSDKVVGETAEEYVEQLVGIYKQSEGYNSFIDNIRKHYETTDALEEFATILMMSIGAPAGSTLAKSLFDSSKKMYNTMNRAERKVADQMADEIHTENKQAMETAVEETAKEEKIDLQEAENKPIEQITNEPINQAETNITPSSSLSSEASAPSSIEPLINTENDKENTSRLQSNEREGQEPIETKPNKATSGEKTETSGVLQTPKEEVKSNADYKRIENILYNKWRDLNGKLSKIPKSSNEYELTKKELDAVDKELTDFRNSNTDLILEHGTPHDFDKFQLEKIGTGEGHQAFGYGLYFTENSKIAKSYAEKLSKDKEGIIYQVKIKDGRNKEWLEWRDALDDSQAEKISSIVKSKKAEYDKYLSETQKEETHTGAAEQLFNENLSVDERPLQVGAVYSDLKDAFGQQEATKIMQDAGFDGVKYKTKGGKGEDFNYVIFDPKSIIIENKKTLFTKEKVEPPVVEQTTTDVGGAKTPSVSEIDIETQQKDALVNDLSAFNKLTSKAKSSSKGVGALNKIKSKAEALGFTVRENKGKIEVINTNGKKLVKSKTVEEVAEPTPEARDNFKKLFKEGVITPSLASETLEPTQIRAAIEAFKNGKETKDVKRLMNEFSTLEQDTVVNYKDYDQATGQWVNSSVPLSEMLTQEVDVENLTEKEINELADVYDEMFANIDEETKTQLTNLFYEEQDTETRQQDQSENSTSSKSSTKAKGTKGSEKVVKVVEKILENELEPNGSLSKSATIRTQKRNTAVKQVKSELDTKEAKAVETVIANYDKIRDILIDKGLIEAIDCKWVR